MHDPQQLESIIRLSLTTKANKIQPPNNLFERIKANLIEDRNEISRMSNTNNLSTFKLRRAVAIGICCIFIFTGSVFAAEYIGKFVQGYGTIKNYSKLPPHNELKKDAGFEAHIPETLPGGFKLEYASLAGYMDGSSNSKQDDNRKLVDAIYKKESGNQDAYLTLSACKDATETPASIDAKSVNLGKKTAKWWEYTLHVVPSGYQTTEIEMEHEKAGKLVTVYISSKDGKDSKTFKEHSTTVRSIKWKDGDIFYVLSDKGFGLSLEEFKDIAESIIQIK